MLVALTLTWCFCFGKKEEIPEVRKPPKISKIVEAPKMTDTVITEKSKKLTKIPKQPEERKNTKSFRKKERLLKVKTLIQDSADDNESEEDVKDSDREENKTTQSIEEYIDYN